MKTIVSTLEMQKFSEQARLRKKTVGLVPTMGYLHKGHLSLIGKAQRSCDVVITSIFVNPTQFAPTRGFCTLPAQHRAGHSTLYIRGFDGAVCAPRK